MKPDPYHPEWIERLKQRQERRAEHRMRDLMHQSQARLMDAQLERAHRRMSGDDNRWLMA
jgi:hypothetical protein